MEDLKKKREKPPHPNASASPLSQLTFSWMFSTFFKGCRRDLEVEDLYEPLKEHRSDVLGDTFESCWEKEARNAAKNKKNPSLLRVIAKVFLWQNTMYSLILAVTELFIRLVQPFLIGLLVRFFSIENQNMPPASELLESERLLMQRTLPGRPHTSLFGVALKRNRIR